MKKLLVLFLVILIFVSSVFPSAAASKDAAYYGIPNIDLVWDPYDVPWGYAFITKNLKTGQFTLWLSVNAPVYYLSNDYIYLNNGYAYSNLVDGLWEPKTVYMGSSVQISTKYQADGNYNQLIWTYTTIKNENGNDSFYSNPSFFDNAPPSAELPSIPDTPDVEEDDGGILSSIRTGFRNLLASINSVFSAIYNGFRDLPSNIGDALSTYFGYIKDAITAIPDLVLDRFKAFMLPDAEALQETLNDFTDQLSEKFNIDTTAFENLFKSEKPIEDIYFDYSISGVGDFNFKALDSSLLVEGVSFFRPYIRGFLVLMLFLYHVRQLIGFFGYDAGVVAGRTEHIKSMRKSQEDD